MRALIISPTPSHPTVQGNRVRVVQIASALRSRGFIVEFFYYAMDGWDAETLEAMRAAWDCVYLAGTGPFVPRQKYPSHWGIDDWVSPHAMSAIAKLASARHYDLVVCNYVWCSALLLPFEGSGARLVIDAHDAFGGRHDLARRAGLVPHWFYTSLEEEGRGFDRADLVLAIQEDEGFQFRRQTSREVYVLEYSQHPCASPLPTDGPMIVGYLGSRNPWNVESLEQFDRALREWPRFQALSDRFEFRVYGGVCTGVENLRALETMGRVETVDEFYNAVDIVVNPMIGGTGLKIKTVEALAFGRAILSTVAGGAGLEHIHANLSLPSISAIVERLDRIHTREDIHDMANESRIEYERFCHSIELKIDTLLGRLGLRPM